MDYYPFGQEMQGRSIAKEIFNGSNNYRYGFNDDRELACQSSECFHSIAREVRYEVSTGANAIKCRSLTSYDYGFRIYNPGIARVLSVDPLTSTYPMLTPYQFASNTPILAIDLDGLEAAYKRGESQNNNKTTKLSTGNYATTNGLQLKTNVSYGKESNLFFS